MKLSNDQKELINFIRHGGIVTLTDYLGKRVYSHKKGKASDVNCTTLALNLIDKKLANKINEGERLTLTDKGLAA